MSEAGSKLEIEDVGRITVAKIIDSSIRDERTIQILGNQLCDLVDAGGRKDVIVDFSNVHYFSSAALNQLVMLQQRVKNAGGRLCLCGVNENVREIFDIIKMTKLFQICPDRAAALARFE